MFNPETTLTIQFLGVFQNNNNNKLCFFFFFFLKKKKGKKGGKKTHTKDHPEAPIHQDQVSSRHMLPCHWIQELVRNKIQLWPSIYF